jgi:hypothetical protein
MSAQRRSVSYRTREQLAEAMRAAILSDASAAKHDDMARAINVAPRTLYRLREKFNVPWPPFDDWDALLRMAGGGEQAIAETVPTSWLISYTLSGQRWVTATTIDEALAKIRAELGPRVVINSVQQA